MFALVAAIPAILVAIVASITLDIGLDRWFEIRTKAIVSSSLSIAEAYVQENAPQSAGHDAVDGLRPRPGALALQSRPDRLRRADDPAGARARRWPTRSWCSSDGSVIMRRTDRAELRHAAPSRKDAIRQADGRPAGADRARRRATSSAPSSSCGEIPDAYLYTVRLVDPEVIKATPDRCRPTSDEYRGLEATRPRTQIAFALLYLGLDADHHAVRDLDRHCRRRPAGAADPPADRRRRRGRDRQSRRRRSGARLRRRCRARSATPSTR